MSSSTRLRPPDDHHTLLRRVAAAVLTGTLALSATSIAPIASVALAEGDVVAGENLAAAESSTWMLDLPYTEGTLSDDGATFTALKLNWSPADPNVGRNQDAYWVGMRYTAPDSVTDDVINNWKGTAHDDIADNNGCPQYSNDGGSTWKNFAKNQDGKNGSNWYMQAWVPVKPETIDTWIKDHPGESMEWVYKFTANGDRSTAQTFNIVVDPQNVELYKDGELQFKTADGKVTVVGTQAVVAYIGSKYYTSLQAAIDDATEGDTIDLAANVTEAPSINKSVSIDLGGNKLTINGGGMKVTGGEVTITNGTIESAVADAIQTSGDAKLTVGKDLTINVPDGAAFYVQNGSELVVDGATVKSEAATPSYTMLYADGSSTITVKSGTITGNAANINAADSAQIVIEGGEIFCGKEKGVAVVTSSETAKLTVTGGEITSCASVIGVHKGTAELKGGTITSTVELAAVYGYSGTKISIADGVTINAKVDAVQATGGCQVTIDGGNFTGGEASLSSGYAGNADGSLITVNDGQFSGNIRAYSARLALKGGTFDFDNVLAAGGTIEIDGGSFTGSLVQAQSKGSIKGSISISDGTFTVPENKFRTATEGKLSITGGAYSHDKISNTYLPTDKILAQDDDNWYRLHTPIADDDVSGVKDAVYTGKNITQDVVVKVNDETLTLGTDYEVTYEANKAVGDATVIVKGTGAYTGEVAKTFSIAKAPVTVTAKSLSKTYGEADPELAATVAGKPESGAEVSYKLERKAGEDVGKYDITASQDQANPNYNVTYVAGTFEIKAAQIPTPEKIADVTYDGKKHEVAPVVKLNGNTLKAGTDYTVSYSGDTTKVGTVTVTVTGKGNLTGTASTTYKIAAAQIPTPEKIADVTYDGKKHEVEPIVEFNGAALAKGTDYTVSYSGDTTEVGTVTVTVTGMGNFTGTATTTYKIAEAPITAPGKPTIKTVGNPSKKQITIKWKAVKGATSYKVAYRKVGAKKWTTKTTTSTKYVAKKLSVRGLYEFKVAAVKKAGNQSKAGSWSTIRRRYLKNVSTKVKSVKGGVKVTWAKDAKASSYQVLYSTSKDMKDAQVVTVSKNKKSYTIKGIKKGTKVYVRVRPMRKSGDNTYTGVLKQQKSAKAK